MGLALALMSGLLLLFMLRGLIFLATSDVYRSRHHYTETNCLFIAEAGIARALSILEATPDYKGSLQSGLSDTDGEFRFEFNDGPPLLDHQSINNLDGQNPVPGPGGVSVPPHSVYLVVQAECNGQSRTLRTVISPGGGYATGYGLAAARNIWMRGQVEVDGIESTTSLNTVEAGLHSNRPDDVAGIIRWTQEQAGDQALISGKVSSRSANATAIDMSGATVQGGTETEASAVPIPDPGILSTIASNSSLPAPAVNPVGLTQLPSGDYYVAGDLALNGDLALDGATLYVEGALSVNGSISGSGAVYVGGTTDFKGDTMIQTHNPEGVALHSHGRVRLSGFDGSEYLDALAAADPVAADLIARSRDALQQMQTLITNADIETLFVNQANDDAVELQRRRLADHVGSGLPPEDLNSLGRLKNHIETQPAGPTRDFLVNRLDSLRRIFAESNATFTSENPAGFDSQEVVADWVTGQMRYYGYYDAITEKGDVQLMNEMINLIQQLDYDKLGTSHFQGIIYTDAFVLAENEVNILGALQAGADPNLPPETVDGVTYHPGDIVLNSGIRLTLNQEYQENQGSSGGRRLTVRTWLEP